AINNNNLTSNNGQDLVVIQNNTAGGMTIGSNITDSTGSIGLTKSGAGSLTLTPNTGNTFTGQLTINAGSVILGNANALNSASPVNVVFGGTTQTQGGNGNFLITNGTLTLNGNSASVASITSSSDSSGTAIVQNASATPATLTISGGTNTTFAGNVID